MDPAPPPITFYRIDATRITLTECWWGTRSPLALVVWLILKLNGRNIPCSTDDPAVESLAPFQVSPDLIPEPVQKLLEPATAELAALGFAPCLWHKVIDGLHATDTLLVTYSHPSLPVVARMHVRAWEFKPPARVFCELLTAYGDGSFLWSLSSKPDTLAPPSCRTVRHQGATPTDLFARHEQARASAPGPEPAVANSPDRVASIVNRHHDAVRQFHLRRGVFAPLTPADIDKRTAVFERRRQAAETGQKYSAILEELHKLQNRKTSWGGAVALLALSLVAFLAIGFKGLSLARVLGLVGVLFFHESGHFLAMKLFGYRNVRMFFIPGFGAAVTGRSYNVAGWKKVIVSLMGPLPGIILGIGAGIAGLIWSKPWAVDAALLLVIINGLNLIPILPLDGGRIAHTILFSRHQILDAAFRAGTAVLLIAGAIFLKDRFLYFLAFILVMNLPYALRVARAARELRREGVEPLSPDSQTIPTDTAERIITKLKALTPKPQPNKVVAQQTLDVFESLNTRAPGWLASIGLLGTHLFALLASVFFILVFVMGQHGALGDFFRAAASSPSHTLTPSAIRGPSSPAGGSPAPVAKLTVMAPCQDSASAAAAYEAILPLLQPGETATLFGDAMLVRSPDESRRDHWTTTLQPHCTEVFVNGGKSRITFTLQCIAPDADAAKSLHRELELYFHQPLTEPLFAPWSPTHHVTPGQERARRTWAALISGDDTHPPAYKDPAAKALAKKVSEAFRSNDQTQGRALSQQYGKLLTELGRAREDRIAQDKTGTYDAAMTCEYIAFTKADPDGNPARSFATRLGAIPTDNAGIPDDTTNARAGYPTRVSLILRIDELEFDDPAEGLRALTNWLSAKKCSTFRFDADHYEDESDP